METLPPGLNLAFFASCAAAIWWAGTRLERYADTISHRTNLGQAFTGMILLAMATSLPEVATTVTAVAILNNPTLAVHNLLGGVALQTAILAIADGSKKRSGALTYFSPRFALLIQGVGLILLLQLTTAGVTAGGVPEVFSVSVWLIALAAAYAVLIYMVRRDRGDPGWMPARVDRMDPKEGEDARRPGSSRSTRTLSLVFAGLSLLVLVGGWGATQTAEALASQTGLGSAFVGATLLAAATSLPEVSATVSAARNRRYTAAMANIFWSNSFDVGLLLLADILYREGSILAHAETSVVFVAMVGSVMTCLYLWGLMERENRTVLGIGWDSAAAVAVYLGGMAVLYVIQGRGAP
jgi:cation:H+ antiporter